MTSRPAPGPPQAPLLQVQGLHASYGEAQVLFGIDLAVRAGEAVALMGRNGAGKSTTMKAIMGLLPHRRGAVRLAGEELGALPTHEIARRGIGWVPEDRRIFTDLTVAGNLEVGRRAPRADAPAWSREAVLELFPNLAEMLDRPAGRMSGGEQQMLAVARTLMGNPRLLLLDEPSEGVAPLIVRQMARAVDRVKREGVAILVSEQNLGFARAVCDRVYVLEQGQVRFAGAMDALMRDEPLRRATLGV